MEKPDLYSLLKQFSVIGGMAEIGQPGFCLLMALWQKSNELNWANQFTMTNTELLYRSGYASEAAMIAKRNTLKQLGYLDYIPPKKSRSCGTYVLNFDLIKSRSENSNDYFKQSHSGAINDNDYSKQSHSGVINANDFTKQSHSGTILESFSSHSEAIPITLKNQTKPNKTKKDKEIPAPSKTLFLEFVELTPEEYQKLLEKLGEEQTQKYIERLDGYIGQIGVAAAKKKYVSHYHTILNWARKDGQASLAEKKSADLHAVDDTEYLDSGYVKSEGQLLFEQEQEELRKAEERRANGYVPEFIRQRQLARQGNGGCGSR